MAILTINNGLYNAVIDQDFRVSNLQVTGQLEVLGGGLQEAVTLMTANGAVTVKSGVVQITKGTACVMTLAAPTSSQEGTVITFDSATAAAHTLTITAGLRGAGTGADVGTWGGAIGDGISLYASGGFWWPMPGTTQNVTFA